MLQTSKFQNFEEQAVRLSITEEEVLHTIVACLFFQSQTTLSGLNKNGAFGYHKFFKDRISLCDLNLLGPV